MRKKELQPRYLSALCLELATLLQAGISINEGLYMLYTDDDSPRSKALLQGLYEDMESGENLAGAVEHSGAFPAYMTAMLRLGERTGRMEETLRALSAYYDQREQLRSSLRSAVAYPMLLLLLMGAVVVLLVTRVLPVFQDVFAQLGAQMSPFATALMHFGQGLSGAAVYILAVLGLLVLVALLLFAIPTLRSRTGRFFRWHFGGRGIAGRRAAADFASAMAAGMASGLDVEEALELAGQVSGGSKQMQQKLTGCRTALDSGESLEQALAGSGIFSHRDSRMLSLGIRAGAGDSVMQQLAARSQIRVQAQTEAAMGRIEPAIVILLSVLVGGVLLSVMLPLLGILSVIA